jgi:hypothetical protein
MCVLQLHATICVWLLLRSPSPTIRCASAELVECVQCLILRNVQAPISCDRSSPHLHCITRKKHVAPNACVRASRKLRARGEKPCRRCPTHKCVGDKRIAQPAPFPVPSTIPHPVSRHVATRVSHAPGLFFLTDRTARAPWRGVWAVACGLCDHVACEINR